MITTLGTLMNGASATKYSQFLQGDFVVGVAVVVNEGVNEHILHWTRSSKANRTQGLLWRR